MKRRDFLKKTLQFAAAAWAARSFFPARAWAQPEPLPVRAFGRTGHSSTLFGLGGEGILRTHGRHREAMRVIERALELGVNYCDTAPAYSQSQDYYGGVFRARPELRKNVFLASKTHDRSFEGSMNLLHESLKRLGTDHLDLWQLHDLREQSDLDQIFSEDGALRALELARKQGKVRFLGITGHHDPAILRQAAERYDFDAALVALNPADRHENSFIENFLPTAQAKGMGVIGMKVYSRGQLMGSGLMTAQEAFGYALSLPVSHVILGCDNPAQVEQNAQLAAGFQPFTKAQMTALEARTLEYYLPLTSYKKGR